MKISATIAAAATAIATVIAAPAAAPISARIEKPTAATARAVAAATANPILIGTEAITRQVLVPPPPHPTIIITHVAKIKSSTEAIVIERGNENGIR